MISMSQKNYFFNQKILLVEHIDKVRKCIVDYLSSNGHQIEVALNGMVALDKFKSNYYDLIIIEKNLPYKDAQSLTESIKNSFNKIPVLYISHQYDEKTKPLILLQNFEKDFSAFFEQAKHFGNEKPKIEKEQNLFKIGNYTLNTTTRELQFKNEKPVKLSPKLNKLLRILMQHEGKLVTKELLIKKVWYNDKDLNLKSIGVYITKLRKLLAKDPSVNINNIYKKGFILQLEN